MVLLIFWILLFFPSTIVSNLECPLYPPAEVSCPHHPIIYMFDETDYLGYNGFISEINYFLKYMIPIMDFSSTVFQGTNGNPSYSTRMLGDFVMAQLVSSTNDACFALSNIRAFYNTHIAYDQQNNNLMTMVQSSMKWAEALGGYSGPTTIVLFASTQNKTEIQEAASYVTRYRKQENFLVVAMRGADFSNFPATNVFNIYDLDYAPYPLACNIQSAACGANNICIDCSCSSTVTSTRQPSSYSTRSSSSNETTTTPNVKITTSTSTSTSTSASTPTPWNSLTPKCNCEWHSVWNDVIFLFDASSSTTNSGLQEMWDSVRSWLAFFNVQNNQYTDSEQFMQIGVIIYGNESRVISGLGEWDWDHIDAYDQLPYTGDSISNIEMAIKEAHKQFLGPNARNNSRRVIFIMATSYNLESDYNGIQASNTFQEDNGVMMVFNYIETHGDPTPELQLLASPGYFFTNLNNSNEDLQNAQCDANCRCLPGYYSYTNSKRETPTGGCYTFATTQANFKYAQQKCSLFMNSILATDESSSKTAFFRSHFKTQSNFWIGLSFNNITNRWQWENGQPLNQSYVPWGLGVQPNGQNGLTSVYVGTGDMWYSTDPRNGFIYSCESKPCDSTNYCSSL